MRLTNVFLKWRKENLVRFLVICVFVCFLFFLLKCSLSNQKKKKKKNLPSAFWFLSDHVPLMRWFRRSEDHRDASSPRSVQLLPFTHSPDGVGGASQANFTIFHVTSRFIYFSYLLYWLLMVTIYQLPEQPLGSRWPAAPLQGWRVVTGRNDWNLLFIPPSLMNFTPFLLNVSLFPNGGIPSAELSNDIWNHLSEAAAVLAPAGLAKPAAWQTDRLSKFQRERFFLFPFFVRYWP